VRLGKKGARPFAAASPELHRGVLPVIGVLDDALRIALRIGHLEGRQDESVRRRSASLTHHATAEGIVARNKKRSSVGM